MAGNESFFFEDKVGIIEEAMSTQSHFRDSEVIIRMAQNGFKLHYQNMDFVATTLDGALEMIEKWFKDMMKEAKERDKDD